MMVPMTKNEVSLFVAGVMVPISTLFSALFPAVLQPVAIVFWMLAFPVFVFMFSHLRGIILFLVGIFVLLMQVRGLSLEHLDKLSSILMSLAVVIYVTNAKCRWPEKDLSFLAIGLGVGAFASNVATVYVMYLVTNEVVSLSTISEIFGIPDEFGLFRFALGNAIHVPFLLTLCTILACIFLRSQYLIFAFLLLNLICAAIAQSRGVLLIALFHMLTLYPRLNAFFKVAIPFICIFSAYYFLDEISIITDSLVSRFSGDDYGSADVRSMMVALVLDSFDASILLLGGGLLSTQELWFKHTGEFASVESSIMELSYELGLLGSMIVLLPLGLRVIRDAWFGRLPLVFYLILGQTFLLVPISTMYGLTMTLTILLLNCWSSSGPGRSNNSLVPRVIAHN